MLASIPLFGKVWKAISRVLPKPLDAILTGCLVHLRIITVPSNSNTTDYWNNIWAAEGSESRDTTMLHEHLLNLIPDHGQIIELGCGNGQLLKKIAQKKSLRCVGLDFSDQALRYVRDARIDAVQTYLPLVPFASGSFDCAICAETLEHLDDPLSTIAEMSRVLRDGGILVFSVPDGCVWGRGGEHVQEFKPTDCVNALRHHVRSVHLMTMVDPDGYPYLICWGIKSQHPPNYAVELRRRVPHENGH